MRAAIRKPRQPLPEVVGKVIDTTLLELVQTISDLT
jgi:hypothetical protein